MFDWVVNMTLIYLATMNALCSYKILNILWRLSKMKKESLNLGLALPYLGIFRLNN